MLTIFDPLLAQKAVMAGSSIQLSSCFDKCMRLLQHPEITANAHSVLPAQSSNSAATLSLKRGGLPHYLLERLLMTAAILGRFVLFSFFPFLIKKKRFF